MTNLEQIGSAIRSRRQALNITQQTVADLAGVGRRVVIEVEQGRRSVSVGIVSDICKVVGLNLAAIP